MPQQRYINKMAEYRYINKMAECRYINKMAEYRYINKMAEYRFINKMDEQRYINKMAECRFIKQDVLQVRVNNDCWLLCVPTMYTLHYISVICIQCHYQTSVCLYKVQTS